MSPNPHQNDAERTESATTPSPATAPRAAMVTPSGRGGRSALPRLTAAWAVRIAAVGAIAWAAIAPIYRAPTAASASSQATTAQAQTSGSQALGEYAVAGGAIGNYFTARGGQRTFGPAISNTFTLTGADVQIFRNHVLKQNPDGSVSTLPLL